MTVNCSLTLTLTSTLTLNSQVGVEAHAAGAAGAHVAGDHAAGAQASGTRQPPGGLMRKVPVRLATSDEDHDESDDDETYLDPWPLAVRDRRTCFAAHVLPHAVERAPSSLERSWSWRRGRRQGRSSSS